MVTQIGWSGIEANERIPHPSQLKGIARTWWAIGQSTAVLSDVVCMLLLVAAFYDQAGSGSFSWLYLAAAPLLAFAAYFGKRWMSWLAWAEVPGAWRPLDLSSESNRRLMPDNRIDVAIQILRSFILTIAGLFIAQIPGEMPPNILGFVGGLLIALTVVLAVNNLRIKADRWQLLARVCYFMTGLLYCAFGQFGWTVIAVFLVAVASMLRVVYRAYKYRPKPCL